jgi:CheY-like chemotaxis protein
VLVVDDQQDFREMYSQYFRYEGIGVTTAQDGSEALDIARTYPPDVIVMDLAMPGTNGWDFLSEARLDARVKEIPVVVVTAYGETTTKDAALGAGAAAFVDKPVLPQALLSVVRRTAMKGRLRRGH